MYCPISHVGRPARLGAARHFAKPASRIPVPQHDYPILGLHMRILPNHPSHWPATRRGFTALPLLSQPGSIAPGRRIETKAPKLRVPEVDLGTSLLGITNSGLNTGLCDLALHEQYPPLGVVRVVVWLPPQVHKNTQQYKHVSSDGEGMTCIRSA
jgi:hypothetical protein